MTKPGEISGISPITAGSPQTIKTKFTTAAATKVFTRVVYNVVPNVGTTSGSRDRHRPDHHDLRPHGRDLQ